MRIDAVVKTEKDRLAIFYDTGLVADRPTWNEIAWIDTEGQTQASSRPTSRRRRSRCNVRHRAIVAGRRSRLRVACFPPPHQFQFPRDYSTNLGFVWHGAGYQGQAGKVGFGIRQNKDGGGNFVPWFNAPPGVTHRMGVFYLLTQRLSRRRARRNAAATPTTTASSSCPATRPSPATTTWRSPSRPCRSRPRASTAPSRPNTSACSKTWASTWSTSANSTATEIRKTPARSGCRKCRRCSTSAAAGRTTSCCLMPGEEANVHLGLTHAGQAAGPLDALLSAARLLDDGPRRRSAVRRGNRPLRQGLSRRRAAAT